MTRLELFPESNPSPPPTTGAKFSYDLAADQEESPQKTLVLSEDFGKSKQ